MMNLFKLYDILQRSAGVFILLELRSNAAQMVLEPVFIFFLGGVVTGHFHPHQLRE